MKTQWYKGVPKSNDKLKKERKEVIYASKPGLEILALILNDTIEELQKSRDAEDVYGLPSYGFHQADHAGQIKAFRKVLNLINFKQET